VENNYLNSETDTLEPKKRKLKKRRQTESNQKE